MRIHADSDQQHCQVALNIVVQFPYIPPSDFRDPDSDPGQPKHCQVAFNIFVQFPYFSPPTILGI